MTFPLPDDNPERADFVPASLPSLRQRLFGQSPTAHLPPLTLAWFKGAMTPHDFDPENGIALRALTPPSKQADEPRSYAGIIILVAVLLAAATWAAFAMGIGR